MPSAPEYASKASLASCFLLRTCLLQPWTNWMKLCVESPDVHEDIAGDIYRAEEVLLKIFGKWFVVDSWFVNGLISLRTHSWSKWKKTKAEKKMFSLVCPSGLITTSHHLCPASRQFLYMFTHYFCLCIRYSWYNIFIKFCQNGKNYELKISLFCMMFIFYACTFIIFQLLYNMWKNISWIKILKSLKQKAYQ